MRAVVQRVLQARVLVEDAGESLVVGSTAPDAPGLLILLGAGRGDGPQDVSYLVRKICGLRIFEDDDGLMNRSVVDVQGSLLVVSQFTLYGDCRKGRRPSFVSALEPDLAEELVAAFVSEAGESVSHVETGRFGAHMQVELVNDGPVTLLLDSRKEF